ncbi:DUF1996 domain-containing protein [Ilumatobacter fluminis]|uniref:DUF1996 domain-containing protein n=1 Tax=Ilumatobacter fluminis TaxID=467091 RepID=UPI00105F6F3E|nr:DUF1996 domain-containing protein [Ilumatobacter fluminis]
MRSPFRISRTADRPAPAVAAVAVVTAVAVLAGCGSSDPELAGSDEPAVAVDAPDRVLTGPQGTRGQFVVECGFDRFLPDDPIVHPGAAGASHLHQFFGAVDVSVESTYDEMLEGATTCDQLADTASYWTPTLVGADGAPVEPLRAVAYYRAGPDIDPTTVVPYPPGMMMVAGDHTAIEPQPLSIVSWSCESGGRREVRPFDCTGAPSLRMWITFQDCWNGVDERSPIVPKPSMHVAYSAAGECPESHPVPIPQLQLAIDFPVPPVDDLDQLALSSGNILSGHADFWNAWHQDKLRNEVVNCIHRDLPCGVSG